MLARGSLNVYLNHLSEGRNEEEEMMKRRNFKGCLIGEKGR